MGWLHGWLAAWAGWLLGYSKLQAIPREKRCNDGFLIGCRSYDRSYLVELKGFNAAASTAIGSLSFGLRANCNENRSSFWHSTVYACISPQVRFADVSTFLVHMLCSSTDSSR